MTDQHLHIVSLDVPYPADYGGAIDIYYRIKALRSLGFQITLHVFEYGRGEQDRLKEIADHVFYYPRKRSWKYLFSKRPFIVQSRISKALLDRLLQDNSPILFEGLHTTWYLENPKIQQRLTFVRTHNIEHKYYQGLKKRAGFLKSLFFNRESTRLRHYEKILMNCSHILAITEADKTYFEQFHPSVYHLPASIPDIEGKYQEVLPYALYHGNLSVQENIEAVYWIINALTSVLDPKFPIIIAGKNPTNAMKLFLQQHRIKLIENPDHKVLQQLIQEAKIHLLYTEMATGIKLKLLHCIKSSGHLLVNTKMLAGLQIEEFCTIADEPKSFKRHFIGLQNTVISQEEFEKRAALINEIFDTTNNCKLILKLIKK